MAYTPFSYNTYPYGAFNPAAVRPETQIGQMFSQPQGVPPAQPVGQGQGISPVSRPVTSKEEAMGIAADFSGAPMIFPDMAHNVVYVKRWDYQSGSAVFTEYVPKIVDSEPPAALYATHGDFKELAEGMTQRLNALEAEIDRMKKGATKNDAE